MPGEISADAGFPEGSGPASNELDYHSDVGEADANWTASGRRDLPTADRMTESQNTGKRRWWIIGLALLYVAFTSLATHLPLTPQVQHWAERYDKLAHLGLYLMMSLLLGAAFWPRRRAFEWGLAITCVLLTADEVLQAFVPSRHVDVKDWIAGIVGAIGGWCVGRALLLWRARRRLSLP